MQFVFLEKKYYLLKKLSSINRTLRSEYQKDGASTCSVIKNIVSRFEKYGSVQHVTRKK